MRNPIRAAWTWLADDHVLFTSPGVGRIFMRCDSCSRLRPAWELVAKAGSLKRLTCTCGSKFQRPTNLPAWRAFWWLIVVGWLWRKTVRRETFWDPRLPMRSA